MQAELLCRNGAAGFSKASLWVCKVGLVAASLSHCGRTRAGRRRSRPGRGKEGHSHVCSGFFMS